MSNKVQLEELLLYFGLEWAVTGDTTVLNEEEILLMLALVRSSRYLQERPASPVPCNSPWWKTALLDDNYSSESFVAHFRMSRSLFWEVQKLIAGNEIFEDTVYPAYLQIAVAFYRFGTYGNAASLTQTASKFSIGKGSTILFTDRVIKALTSMSKLFIRWPNKTERAIIGNKMAEKGLPKCIGFVDGSDVGFAAAPVTNPEVYWSRKKKYAMQIQVICDPDNVIIDLFTGYPASVHDAKIYGFCPPGRTPELFFSEGEFLIGDAAYSLTETVVVPFRRCSSGLTSIQRKFNYHLSQSRVAVEHTIGMLKNRFQSLKELRILITNDGHCKAVEWIHACVILHNVLVKKEPWDYNVNEANDEIHIDEDNETGELGRCGVAKREALLAIYKALI